MGKQARCREALPSVRQAVRHGRSSVAYLNVYGPNQRYDAYGNVIPIFVFRMLEGKPITIFETRTEYGGRMVPCLRVRIDPDQASMSASPAPQPAPEPVPAGGEDDCPF